MVRRRCTARSLFPFAALAVILCEAWLPGHARLIGRSTALAPRSTSDATVWVAALPAALKAPAVPKAWQLVSMIADDIDADGDLDVVANDGSLELIVWMNDSTGRLTRQESRKPAQRLRQVSGPDLADQQPDSRAVAHTPASALEDSSTVSNPIDALEASPTRLRHAPLSFVRSNSAPRGPPRS